MPRKTKSNLGPTKKKSATKKARASVLLASEESVPVKESTAPATKPKNARTPSSVRPKRKSEAEAREILAKVVELQAQDATISHALKVLNVPYANYNYWVKKYGKGGSQAQAGQTGAEGLGGKAVNMQTVLDKIAALRASGTSLGAAIKQNGLTVSNYYYWVRQLKAPGMSKAKLGAKPGRPASTAKARDVTAVLDAMKRNRIERAKLDTEWQELLRKLESEA